jgi:hypothetical protein
MLPTQVGIGKRQNNQSIVIEDNEMAAENAAKFFFFFESLMWFPFERRMTGHAYWECCCESCW